MLVGEALTETMDQPANVDAASGKPMLAFVHVPRTGGGTLSTAIARNYAPQKSVGNYQRGPEKTRQGLEHMAKNPGMWEAVGDHVPYGLLRRYLPGDTRYITILRDPVDRVLSHFHFHAQAGDPPGSAGARKLRNTWQTLLNNERLEQEDEGAEEIELDPEAEYTLEEGLRKKIVIYDNFMTRFLWGGESIFGELPPDALERAKENVSTFWFVAFRERLDDSIVLLGRQLGVGLMPYYLRHVSQKRPPLVETSDELRELIAEHNALDVELYRFARERFEQESPTSEELAEDVLELRARSEEVTALAEKAREEKKEANQAQKRAERDERAAQNQAERDERAAQNRAERDERAAENRARRIERRGGTKGEKRAKRGGTKDQLRAARGGTKAEAEAAPGEKAAPEAAAGASLAESDEQTSSAASGRRARRVKPKTKGKAERRASRSGASAAATEDVAASDGDAPQGQSTDD